MLPKPCNVNNRFAVPFIFALAGCALLLFTVPAPGHALDQSTLLSELEELAGARLVWGADQAAALEAVNPGGYWGVRSDSDFRGSRLVEVDGQPFRQAWRVAMGQKPGNPWGAQVRGKLPVALEAGRPYLFSLTARARVPHEEDEATTPRAKGAMREPVSAEYTVGPEWRRFYFAFQPDEDYAAGEFEVVKFVGFDKQIIEIGGLALFEFGSGVDMEQVSAVARATAPPHPDAPQHTDPRQPDVDEVTGAQVNEELVSVVLHVNKRHAQADDENPGTLEQPLRTFATGLERAKERLARGESVKLQIHPGIYREGGIVLSGAGLGEAGRNAVLVIEGGDGVVIRGSEDWSQADWQPVRDEAGNLLYYRADWPHTFGLRGPGWGRFDPKRGPGAFRREMVFVDGRPLTDMFIEQYEFEQGYRPGEDDPHRDIHGNTHLRYTGFVEPRDLLVPGTFAVAEREDKNRGLYLRLPEGKEMGDATIEVSVHPYLLAISAMENLVVRGIRFEHGAPDLQQGAVMLGSQRWQNLGRVASDHEFDNRNVLIEDCRIEWNQNRGLTLTGGQNITLRRVASNYNGAQGVSVWTQHNLLIEDLETNFNNWSGHRGGLRGWGIAGIKLHGVYNSIVRRHTAIGNLAEGQWWDIDNRDVLIEELVAIGNDNRGLFLEISPGPFRVVNSLMVDGGRHTVRLDAAQDVIFENSIIHSNPGAGPAFNMTPKLAPRTRHTQVVTRRVLENRDFDRIRVSSGPLRISGSVLVSNEPGSTLFFFNDGHPDDLRQLFASGRYTGRGNLFYGVAEQPFGVGMNNNRTVDFDGWLETTREENAQWGDPGFVDTAAYDFRLRDDSPLRNRRDELPAYQMSDETRAAWDGFKSLLAAQPAGDGQTLEEVEEAEEAHDPSYAE